jgi:hypothetical protein
MKSAPQVWADFPGVNLGSVYFCTMALIILFLSSGITSVSIARMLILGGWQHATSSSSVGAMSEPLLCKQGEETWEPTPGSRLQRASHESACAQEIPVLSILVAFGKLQAFLPKWVDDIVLCPWKVSGRMRPSQATLLTWTESKLHSCIINIKHPHPVDGSVVTP